MVKNVKCFVSHCVDDESTVTKPLMALLRDLYSAYPEESFFYTSDSGSEIHPGRVLDDSLREALSSSDVMIAVITDSYIRSVKCVAEISSFWYLGKTVIPVIYNGETGIDFWTKLQDNTSIYLEPKSASSPIQFIKAMEDSGFFSRKSPEETERLVSNFMSSSRQADSRRGYIGSGSVYHRLVETCSDLGISEISDKPLKYEHIVGKLESKKHVYVLSTTGANLIARLVTDLVPRLIKNGGDFTVLLPNKGSDFCRDVADIEKDVSLTRLSNEFSNVMENLRIVVNKVHARNSEAKLGHVYVGCSYTLLRQTVTMGVGEDEVWGWLSVTLPPRRTVNRTPSFEFEEETVTGEERDTFSDVVYNHILSIEKIAKARGAFVEITPGCGDFAEFFSERDSAELYWQNCQMEARRKMKERASLYDDILIEVAAQHPLRRSGKPSNEFRARLDYAYDLYKKLKEKNSFSEVNIYVPGSRHRYNGQNDPVSLSTAGFEYLKSKGIPESDLLGDDMNERYKGKLGVYNSADECFVASKIFDNGEYGQIYCVCSPSQMLRKKLFYMAFYVLPLFHTVPEADTFHDDINEIFTSIPNVLYRDHTWQSENSFFGNRSRDERMPRQ